MSSSGSEQNSYDQSAEDEAELAEAADAIEAADAAGAAGATGATGATEDTTTVPLPAGAVSKRPYAQPWSCLTLETARKRAYRERKRFQERQTVAPTTPVIAVGEQHNQPAQEDDLVVATGGEEPSVEATLDFDEEPSAPSPPSFEDLRDDLTIRFVKLELRKIITENAVTRKATNELLTLMRNFIPDLPRDARTLLETPKEVVTRPVPPGKYTHIGIEPHLIKLIQSRPNVPQTIILDVFADGAALFKQSKKKSFWLVLARFDLSNQVFCVGVYNGVRQPASFNDLMSDFVKEALLLTTEGLTVGGKVYKLKLRNFIADSLAQCDVAYTKGPTGYDSCPYCQVEGESVNDRLTFCDLDKKVVFCKRIHKQDEQVLLDVVFCRSLGELFQLPLKATTLNYFYCSNDFRACDRTSDRIATLPLNGFVRKLFHVPYNEDCCCFAPLHKFNFLVPTA